MEGAGEQDRRSEDDEPNLIERIRDRRAEHKERSKIIRGAYAAGGFTVLLAGIVMTGPVPGPGIIVIPIGLTILALEFVWAERLLEQAIERAESAKQKAADTTTAQKIMSGIAIACGIGAFIAAAIMWDIPLLPV